MGWYLVDSERTNELGQELLHGPFGTLKEARDEISEARKVVQLAGPKAAPAEGAGRQGRRRRPRRGSTAARTQSRPTFAG